MRARVRLEPLWQAVAEVGHFAALQAFLETVEVTTLLRQVECGRITQHPNGFLKLPVATSDRGDRLVFHAWLRDGPGEDNDVHNHRWDFASAVVAGSLATTEYTVHRGQGPLTEYAFSSGSSGGYEVQPVGPCNVSTERAAVMPRGTVYYLSREVFHRSGAALPDPLVTLFLQTPALAPVSSVVRPDVPESTIPAHALRREAALTAVDEIEEVIISGS